MRSGCLVVAGRRAREASHFLLPRRPGGAGNIFYRLQKVAQETLAIFFEKQVKMLYQSLSLLLIVLLNVRGAHLTFRHLFRQSLISLPVALSWSMVSFGAAEAADSTKKLSNLTPTEISKIVAADITERQALITADFTRLIYSEKATFQDEIDIYPIDKYVTGTKALFNAANSHVDLVGTVTATPAEVNFRFQETLAFNVPFNPKVTLSGRVVLTRDENDGLVTASREYWDQSVNDVLKTVTF